ncbi:unnamed protein product [Euphydryas editha]|uniref:Leucine-rich repeat-containing protein 71 n=1 Tax=Euphydryas editha TaxID=104508 RepID=A0AAU9U8M9_EUPED|nr:unnamed protein product [Euphydryas editha]
MKSVRSTKSLRSIRSAHTARSGKIIDNNMQSLDNMILIACAKFNCPYTVTVKKETKQDEYYKSLKQTETKSRSKRINLLSQKKIQESSPDDLAYSDQTPSLTTTSSSHVNNVAITCMYDQYNTLTELKISNVKQVPHILLKIIGLLIPHYRNIVTININNCGINMYIIYELGKMLHASTITELCLDGSALSSNDYSMLFESKNLRNLSLCRCKIYDDACEIIASKLHHTATADNLLLLNLSSNHITDEGAKYFGNALRTNRHLRYLNLANNHISDYGAGYLLDMLIEFPLTHDEILNTRRRRLDYYKLKQTLYAKYLEEYCNNSIDQISVISRKSSKRRKTSTTTLKSKSSGRKEKERPSSANAKEDYVKMKAEMMTAEILGPFIDPFDSDFVKIVDGYIYSFGNMALASLNLAYNNLSYLTIKKLYQVLLYQNVMRNPNQKGLIKVVLDGNNMPVNCTEITAISDLMARNTWQLSSRISEVIRRKSRSLKVEKE